MHKILKIMLAASAILVAGQARSQSVTFLLNDGTMQQFSTDRVKSISIVTPSSQVPAVDLPVLTIEAYGHNAVLHFTNSDKSVAIDLDVYGPSGAVYLNNGTYTVADGGGAFTIGTDPQYTAYIADGSRQKIAAGSMTVASSGRNYNIEGAFTLDNGEEKAFTFSGPLPSYSPFREFTISTAAFNENPQPKGTFYLKMNDAAYNIEMALVLVCDADATTLAPGQYVRASDAAVIQPGTYTTGSYIDLYNPSFSDRDFTGTCTIAVKDKVYSILFEALLSNGQQVAVTYEGEIKGTPTFIDPAKEALLKKGPAHVQSR